MLLVLPVLLVLLVLLVLRSVDRSDDFSAGRAGVAALEWLYGCVRAVYGCVRLCTAVYGRVRPCTAEERKESKKSNTSAPSKSTNTFPLALDTETPAVQSSITSIFYCFHRFLCT